MNKTLLLILCDFLLLNLLALTRWEKVEPPPAATATSIAQKPGEAPPVANELVEAMRQSLADEQSARDRLRSQLETTAADLQQRTTQVAGLEHEKTVLQQDLAGTQQQAERAALEAAARAKEIEASKQRMDQLQHDLEQKERQAREQKEALAALEQKHSAARSQIENLSVAVKVAEQEKVLLRESIDQAKQEVAIVREEKLKLQEQTGVLAQGVTKLAESSGDLTREIRENRPINPNTLFEDYRANWVDVDMFAQRKGLFAGGLYSKKARSILVSDGNAVFAVLHVRDSAFDLQSPTQEYESVRAVLNRGARQLPIQEVGFHALDPRIVLVPVTAEQVTALGVKVYQLAADPFKFEDAMLVGSAGEYFGEIRFRTDPEAPRYVKMDRNFFKRLAGQFAPSTGDLVLAKSGELLGVMVTGEYCLVLNQLKSVGTVHTGTEASGLSTRDGLGAAYGAWRKLPAKLQ